MKAYIHTVGGRPFNEECEAAWRGFEKLGVECVPFSTNEALDAAAHEDIVVGGMLVTGHALTLRVVTPPEIDYPHSLRPYLGRRVWECPVGDIEEGDLPLFVKPRHEKELSGVVARNVDDLNDYLAKGEDYPVWCSEPVEFISEWRFFVRYGGIAGEACYRGDPKEWPDVDVVNGAVDAYEDAPAAYGLDLGVTADGRTLLVEVNDGYALGCYGIDCVAYALFLAARWAELVGSEDEFSDLMSNGKPRHIWPERDFDSDELDRLLDSVDGATEKFRSVASAVSEYNAVGAELVRFLREGERSLMDVWLWLAGRLGLEVHQVAGRQFIFPRAQTVRFVVEPEKADPLGSSSLQRYDADCAVVGGWIKEGDGELRNRLYGLLHDYAELDAASYYGFKRVFALTGDDDYLDEDFYSARGYHRVPDKDEEDLARALGAHVIYGCTVEKDLL